MINNWLSWYHAAYSAARWENIVLWDTFQSHDRRTMFIYDRTRSQTIATDRTNRTWQSPAIAIALDRTRSHSCSHIIGDDRTNRPWFFARDRTRSQSCSQIIGDDRWRSSLIICEPGFRLGVIVPTIIMTFHIRGSKDLWQQFQ